MEHIKTQKQLLVSLFSNGQVSYYVALNDEYETTFISVQDAYQHCKNSADYSVWLEEFKEKHPQLIEDLDNGLDYEVVPLLKVEADLAGSFKVITECVGVDKVYWHYYNKGEELDYLEDQCLKLINQTAKNAFVRRFYLDITDGYYHDFLSEYMEAQYQENELRYKIDYYLTRKKDLEVKVLDKVTVSRGRIYVSYFLTNNDKGSTILSLKQVDAITVAEMMENDAYPVAVVKDQQDDAPKLVGYSLSNVLLMAGMYSSELIYSPIFKSEYRLSIVRNNSYHAYQVADIGNLVYARGYRIGQVIRARRGMHYTAYALQRVLKPGQTYLRSENVISLRIEEILNRQDDKLRGFKPTASGSDSNLVQDIADFRAISEELFECIQAWVTNTVKGKSDRTRAAIKAGLIEESWVNNIEKFKSEVISNLNSMYIQNRGTLRNIFVSPIKAKASSKR